MRSGKLVERPAATIARMRVQLVDPSADVLPYDHALAGALVHRGAAVELVTSRFVHGPRAAPDGYEVSESFYRLATRLAPGRPRLRRLLKGAEHVPGMLAVRRAGADVTHWQWLWLEALSAPLLPRGRPQLLTLHNVIRRERPARRLLDAMDAVIVHTRRGADLLGGGPRVHVIPHGAFEHLTRQPDERPLPPELAAVEGPVVLCFGVVRPYKGVDVLLDAFRSVEGAELWVVGRPLGVSLDPPANVRVVPRYVSDSELPAFFRRADLLVLPHRAVDVSGVLFAGLAFGKPMVLSDIGGFRELVEDHGAGRLVPPEDPPALASAIRELLDDHAERARLAARARAAAAGSHSWDSIAARTLALYKELLAR
jgi:glycosyltransferase involved in cell wall biosynthesis